MGVKFFRQALALDERRARFIPEYKHYSRQDNALRNEVEKQKENLKRAEEALRRGQADAQANVDAARTALMNAKDILEEHFPAEAETVIGLRRKREVECWFMGCHSDVGGGTDQNEEPSLSNIPFRCV